MRVCRASFEFAFAACRRCGAQRTTRRPGTAPSASRLKRLRCFQFPGKAVCAARCAAARSFSRYCFIVGSPAITALLGDPGGLPDGVVGLSVSCVGARLNGSQVCAARRRISSGHWGAEAWPPCAPLLFRGATSFEFHMFVASNHHRQDRYPATCGCTKSSIGDSGSLTPQNLAAGPEQNPPLSHC